LNEISSQLLEVRHGLDLLTWGIVVVVDEVEVETTVTMLLEGVTVLVGVVVTVTFWKKGSVRARVVVGTLLGFFVVICVMHLT